MLTTHDLLYFGNSLLPRGTFIGVYPRNLLPRTIPLVARAFPMSLIYNTDTANLEGVHWIALIIFPDGTGEIFDSFGREPQPIIAHWMTRHCSRGWSYNKYTVQGTLSTLCGVYCLYYLYYRHKTWPCSNFLKKYFPLTNNDKLMFTFYKTMF